MKKKVILTRRWPQAVEDILSERYDAVINKSDTPFTTEQLRDALASADALLSTVTDKVDASVFDIPNIKATIVSNYGVGYSNIDTDAAKSKGLVVTNTPEVLSECTADIAMTLMLMIARRAGEGEREVRAGNWAGWRPTHMVGNKVSGKKVGVIGYGRIGQEFARRAHHGFGMQVSVFDPFKVDAAVLQKNQATQVDSLEELLASVDFVSLHCPGGDANRHLINSESLKLMKPTAYISNTARGEVIDDSALIKALSKKTIAGAGLDVFDGEPNINKGYYNLENAVLLPHLGSATVETREAMGFRVVSNLEAHFDSKEPGDRVA